MTLTSSAATHETDSHSISIHWAQHADEVREAQRLRYLVFSEAMGHPLHTTVPGVDEDFFDAYCEHLLVRDNETRQVVGTYRILHPQTIARLGTSYCSQEFDLHPLQSLRSQMMELGRSCVHPDYRSGTVMLALWQGLADYMQKHHLHAMLGCASVALQHAGMGQGVAAAALWQYLPKEYQGLAQWHVAPKRALDLSSHVYQGEALQTQAWLHLAPALVKGYMRLGTKIIGPPALDADFGCADFPMLFHIDNMHPRYRKHFLR